ncbi:MAG: rhodanese-like domain-containing protein [Paracoccaceae bacterium]
MPRNVKDMMAEANAAVEKIDAARARQLMDKGALVVDVRDAPEVAASGKVKGALHISRGMLEFRADPSTPYHHPELRADRPVVLYCASGGRAALSGKLLRDMGYTQVFNLGGFKDWTEAGGDTEPM